MLEFEINLSEMPLGKLSKNNIQQGVMIFYNALLLKFSFWEISRGNLELSAFPRDRQTFFLIHVVTLSFQLFYMIDKRKVFLLTLLYISHT